MKFFILLMGLMLVTEVKAEYSPSEEDRSTDTLIVQFGKEMYEEYGIKLAAVGGGSDKGIWLMSMMFDLYRPIEKEEARIILVDLTEKFLAKINNNTEVRPFLKVHPFTSKNLDISIIVFASKKRDYTYDPTIGAFSITEGTVRFVTNDPDKKYQYKNRSYETYEDALEIVRQEKLKEGS